MNFLLIFICTSIISFLGSIQLGPVNIFVIDTAIHKNLKSAYWVALGGIIPEFLYSSIAIWSSSLFVNNPQIMFAFKIILIILMTILGLYFWLKKQKQIKLTSPKVDKIQMGNFLKGMTLSIFNPQLLPFWIFVLIYFNSIDLLIIKSSFDKAAYIFGTGFGAFLLLILLAKAITIYKEKVLKFVNHPYYNKLMSLVFFAIATHQLFTLC